MSEKPDELSPKSQKRWDTLVAVYDFTTAERVALTECLLAADRADAFTRAKQHDLAVKERQSSFRWWKSLRFPAATAATAARRVGRPADTNWSRQRRGAGAV